MRCLLSLITPHLAGTIFPLRERKPIVLLFTLCDEFIPCLCCTELGDPAWLRVEFAGAPFYYHFSFSSEEFERRKQLQSKKKKITLMRKNIMMRRKKNMMMMMMTIELTRSYSIPWRIVDSSQTERGWGVAARSADAESLCCFLSSVIFLYLAFATSPFSNKGKTPVSSTYSESGCGRTPNRTCWNPKGKKTDVEAPWTYLPI